MPSRGPSRLVLTNLQEIILHTLFESGITRVSELERYVRDDVVRYGGRLSELEKKLGNAYREAVSTSTRPCDFSLTCLPDH